MKLSEGEQLPRSPQWRSRLTRPRGLVPAAVPSGSVSDPPCTEAPAQGPRPPATPVQVAGSPPTSVAALPQEDSLRRALGVSGRVEAASAGAALYWARVVTGVVLLEYPARCVQIDIQDLQDGSPEVY